MKIAILITTCKRPEMLAQLLDDIKREMPSGWEPWISVTEDVWPDSPEYSSELKQRVDRWASTREHGAAKYSITMYHMWQWLRLVSWDRMLQIPDDVRLERDFFHRIELTWQAIDDPQKVCLSPLRDSRTQCWTGWEMLDMGPAMLSQWTDLAIYTDNRWMDAIYGVPIVVPRRSESSGVGAWLSRRWHDEGMRMYHVKKSLLRHGDHESVMHPEHRKHNPILS